MAQRARREGRVDAEDGAQRGQGRCEEEQPHLAAPAAGAELLDAPGAREQGGERDYGDGQEGEHGHVGARGELGGAVGAADGGVEREEGLDGDGDDHEQGGDDAGDEEAEDEGRGGMPAEAGVVGAHDALREDHVDDEDEDAARLRQHAGGHGDVGRARVRRPRDARAQGGAAQHAQREQHAGEEELEPGPLVQLEDRHVRHRRRHEEREEHGGHGDVGLHRRHAAHDGCRRGVRGAVVGGIQLCESSLAAALRLSIRFAVLSSNRRRNRRYCFILVHHHASKEGSILFAMRESCRFRRGRRRAEGRKG